MRRLIWGGALLGEVLFRVNTVSGFALNVHDAKGSCSYKEYNRSPPSKMSSRLKNSYDRIIVKAQRQCAKYTC